MDNLPPEAPPPGRPGRKRRLGLAIAVGLGLGVALGVILSSSPLIVGSPHTISRNENAAIAALRAYSSAQQVYYTRCGGTVFGGLEQLRADLGEQTYQALAAGTRAGYGFQFWLSPDRRLFTAGAFPLREGKTGLRYFWIDPSGVVRFALDSAVNAASPPVD